MLLCSTGGNWGAKNDINNDKHILGTYNVQGALPNVLHTLASFLFAPVLIRSIV